MNRIFAYGDLHGSGNTVLAMLDQLPKDIDETDVLILCGDVGIKYGEYESGIKKLFGKYPCDFLVMRGNHDVRYWEDIQRLTTNFFISHKYGAATLVQENYLNIHYIEDGGNLYNINNKKILFIPGAYSVDKDYRLKNRLAYEWGEQLTNLEKMNIIYLVDEHKFEIDYIISHTCPFSLQPYIEDLFLSMIDQDSVDKTMEKFLDEVKIKLGCNINYHWYFGHFHADRNIKDRYHMLYRKIAILKGDENENQYCI